jgi:heme/copper-type cytochrome/quinol oxidase subunit 2
MKGSVGIVRIILEHGDYADAKTNVRKMIMMMMMTIIIVVTILMIIIVIDDEDRDYSR